MSSPINAAIVPQDAELSDAESLPSFQIPIPSPTTFRKKARETNLRRDEFCEVLSGTFVRCLNCGKNIKLSLKSDYDASHWVRHRGRCLKRTSKAALLERATQSAETSPTSSPRALSTPPEDEEENDIGADSESPAVTDPSFGTPTAALPIFQPPTWQAWGWSVLKPRFPVDEYSRL